MRDLAQLAQPEHLGALQQDTFARDRVDALRRDDDVLDMKAQALVELSLPWLVRRLRFELRAALVLVVRHFGRQPQEPMRNVEDMRHHQANGHACHRHPSELGQCVLQ